MIQLNYISSKLKYNMDIYYPLFGGYLYSKILPSGSTGDREYWAKMDLRVFTITYENTELDGVMTSGTIPTTYTIESSTI